MSKTKKYSGTTDTQITERELRNRRLAGKAAAEGIVLLKNEGILPLRADQKIAVFGGGAVATVKGGTGSGDVNERESVNIYKGLMEKGFEFTNKEWLEEYTEIYHEERLRWCSMLKKKLEGVEGIAILDTYAANPFVMPSGRKITENDIKDAEAVFYIISRKAGEGADRFNTAGDYKLTESEKEELSYLSVHCENLIVIVNAGGLIELSEIIKLRNLRALLSIVQPGMEGGHALADIVTGTVTPSGKLTDTWAENYFMYPCADSFSHMNGNVEKEYYQEGIYVGYRYFDRFEKKAEYPFGYGLSYTEFELSEPAVEIVKEDNVPMICISVSVKNQGKTYSGKEVVQVYVTCPQTETEKEYKRLCGFAKTKLLAPGEVQRLQIYVTEKSLASFDETEGAWRMEAGKYGIWMGNSSQNISLTAVLHVEKTVILEKTEHICPMKEELTEMKCPKEIRMKKEEEWHRAAQEMNVPVLLFEPVWAEKKSRPELSAYKKEIQRQADEITDQLTEDELISMVIGEISKGQGQALGAAGNMVPGAAGETSSVLEEKYGIHGVSMADGPAGLRLIRSYQVDNHTGEIYSEGILDALEGGILASGKRYPDVTWYYQYCTAIPVGTLLAQTWNEELLEELGEAIAEEMREFGVSWWLAPGMNIHRNPLCGRNFEYYSEDPLVSGKMAAAVTRGVQKKSGNRNDDQTFCMQQSGRQSNGSRLYFIRKNAQRDLSQRI